MTGGLLWYGHKCMRGKDVVDDDLYEETANSMEGFLYLFIYLSSAKNILHKAGKRHNINKYRNTGRGDATAMHSYSYALWDSAIRRPKMRVAR